MHPADLVILVLIAASVLLGLYRGLVREAFALAGWVAAYVVAQCFHADVQQSLADSIASPALRLLLAWGGLFVVTLLLSALAGWMLSRLLQAAGAGLADRLLGAVFGLLRGVILVLAALIMLAPFLGREAWWQQAELPRAFMRYELLGQTLKQQLMEAARDADVSKPVRVD